MPTLNKCLFIGNITKEIELKQTTSGKEFANFSIAVNQKGNKGTDFFNVVSWEDKARFVSQWFKKGDPIFVEGEMHNRSYTDKDGNKRSVTEVTAIQFQFVSPRSESAFNSVATDFMGATPGSSDNTVAQFVDVSGEDDLPF